MLKINKYEIEKYNYYSSSQKQFPYIFQFNNQSFSLENQMITPKSQSLSFYKEKVSRNSNALGQKVHHLAFTQKIELKNQGSVSNMIANYPSLKANIVAMENQQAESYIKLPQIKKKQFEIEDQAESSQLKAVKQNENHEEIKRLQANPYLKKYVGLASNQKLREENSSQFLNIVSVKPIFRSSSRMQTVKDTNCTLTIDKNQQIHEKKSEKLIFGQQRQSDRIKTVSYPYGQHLNEISVKKKLSNLSIKDHIIRPSKRLSLLPREHLKSLSLQKKPASSIKLKKPKNSPNYFEWCLLLGIIDGAICQKEGGQYYKAFVGKGNNSVLVKNIIKNRSWWAICQDESEAHLYWTQSRNPKYLEELKTSQKCEDLGWFNNPKIKLQLFGNCEQGLADKIKNYTGIGFEKILSKNQRVKLCKSPTNAVISYPQNLISLDSNKLQIHNHLQFNWNLSNKKALYYNLKAYYLAVNKNPFDYIPQTYHIQKQGDSEWQNFTKAFQKKSLWIVKPGQNSNRGCGIDVVESIEQVRQIIRNKSIRPNGKERSHIVQKYLMPFLYNKRKFDIRCYMLVTSLRGNLRCYWYEEGYVRTASKQFTTKNLKNRMIHLTNDAVQKHSQQYGKFQSGNKLSFNELYKYMKNTNPEIDFYQKIYPKMMELATDAIKSTHLSIDAKFKQHSFEIFGLDFMIDEKFETWLIEVNTNPCLELSCPLLARIIPGMVENAFKIAIDPIFPPPKEIGKAKPVSEDLFEGNKFSLVFSSREEADLSSVLRMQKLQNIIESEEEDGSICDDQEE